MSTARRYYANGPELPAALRTLESIGASSSTLDDEIDEQLVGIARLVTAPANRARPWSRRCGATGNLAEGGGDIGLARLIYRGSPSVEPLPADLVQIDPGNGGAQAECHRLDNPAPR